VILSGLFKFVADPRLDQGLNNQIAQFTMLIALLLFTGCSSGPVLKNRPDQSLAEIKQSLDRALPRGMRQQSTNGREFLSNYFSTKGDFDEDAGDRPERAYAHVLILGDRRPYRTEVRVYRERRDKKGIYRGKKLDQGLSRRLLGRLQEALSKGRDDRNVIDDFRAF